MRNSFCYNKYTTVAGRGSDITPYFLEVRDEARYDYLRRLIDRMEDMDNTKKKHKRHHWPGRFPF